MIITSQTTIPTEEHFRVIAGPGAGKTTFLVNHIQHIHKNSELLSSLRKIACITYTNSGVQSISKKLGAEFSLVEISTIHSFLYRHVLRPYGSFIADEYNLNMSKVSGQDEHYVERKKVEEWIENHSRNQELNDPFSDKQLLTIRYDQLTQWLRSLKYEMNKCGEIILSANYRKSFGGGANDERYTLEKRCVEILETDTISYKQLYWAEGKIDHDDILFLSLQLVNKYPFILRVLHAKFPYFLVDEFQDSHPIQVELIKRIGEAKTTVGIIGDPAQAIYAFQGAEPGQLKEFSLPGMRTYTIEDNHRSTEKIVKVLNRIRKDVRQKSKVGEGIKPVILVGDRCWSYEKAKELLADESLKVLYRRNDEVAAMIQQLDYASADLSLLEKVRSKDSNGIRRNAILTCMEAVELAKSGQYAKAIRKMRFVIPEKGDTLIHQGKVLTVLNALLGSYASYQKKPLLIFYNLIESQIELSLPKLRDGAGPHLFYSEVAYCDLAVCINAGDFVGNHITIHQAKGAGFRNVLVILENENYLNFLLHPDLTDEEHRVYYVALSRAEQGLFINVPSLSGENRNALGELFTIF